MFTDYEIRDSYNEDTAGRRYHAPIVSSKTLPFKTEKPKTTADFSLNKPMSFNEFLKLSDDLQKMYLSSLHTKFNANATDIRLMFGVSKTCFNTRVIRRLKFQGTFEKGKRMPSEDREKWNEFLGINTNTQDSKKDVVVVPKNQQSHETSQEFNKTVSAPAKFSMDAMSTSMTLQGNMNASEIANRLSAIIPDGVKCSITIHITRSEEVL